MIQLPQTPGSLRQSRLRLILACCTAFIVLTVVVKDSRVLLFSSLCREMGWRVYLGLAWEALFGILAPTALVIGLVPQVRQFRVPEGERWSIIRTRTGRILAYFGLTILVLTLLVPTFIVESLFPFSILPLGGAITGVLWMLITTSLLRRVRWSRRAVVLQSGLCILLAVNAVNWESRRSFLRDLMVIRNGMSVEEVQQVMGDYMHGWPWSDPSAEQTIDPEGCLVYRHSTEAKYNSDIGVIGFHDGVVERVEFLPD